MGNKVLGWRLEVRIVVGKERNREKGRGLIRKEVYQFKKACIN